MKPHQLWVLAVAGILLPVFACLFLKAPTAAPTPTHLPSLDSLGLQEGDLIFRSGRDVMAHIVLSQGDSVRYSHVGALVRENGRWLVIHSMPAEGKDKGGVRKEGLTSFCATEKASSLGFYRSALSQAQRSTFHRWLASQVGKPFDPNFSWQSDSALYCTELILKGLRYAGGMQESEIPSITILTLREPVYPPDHLRRSNRLKLLWQGNQ